MADRIVVLHDGIVEQVGAPLALYDKPANTFVASFIGSPSMNLIEGRIEGGATPGFVTRAGTRLPLRSAPAGSEGRPALYGIRPEHFTLGGDVSVDVTVAEPTGSETQIFARLGDDRVVGVFRDRVEVHGGERIAMTPNPAAVHLFDVETRRRIN